MKISSTPLRRGFTLIELLVVIAIIGVLSSIVLSSLASARTKAQYGALKQQMQDIKKDVQIAQGESGKSVAQITGSFWTAGGCNGVPDTRNVPAASTCYTSWATAIGKIEAAGNGLIKGIGTATRDPWGSPYILDENEGETPGNLCRLDTLRSYGPDGASGTGDDTVVTFTFGSPACQ